MSQRIASPKLTAPPPPIIQARQPIRFTAKVMLFTANTLIERQAQTHTEQKVVIILQEEDKLCLGKKTLQVCD